MLDKGYPIEDICDITGLTRVEVEGLRCERGEVAAVLSASRRLTISA